MKKRTWYVLIALEVLLLIVFVGLALGAELDVKFGMESADDRVFYLANKHIDEFSLLLGIQFLMVSYLLYKLKPAK